MAFLQGFCPIFQASNILERKGVNKYSKYEFDTLPFQICTYSYFSSLKTFACNCICRIFFFLAEKKGEKSRVPSVSVFYCLVISGLSPLKKTQLASWQRPLAQPFRTFFCVLLSWEIRGGFFNVVTNKKNHNILNRKEDVAKI